jgi:hypothetical protein
VSIALINSRKGGVRKSTVMVVDSLRKKGRLSIALMIHSWDPSEMGEVGHEKGNCDVSIALVDSRKGRPEIPQ